MKSTVIWSLVGLNLLLAAIVVARSVPVSSAQAQVRRPSDYLMIPGKVNGLPYTVVYVVDTTQGALGAMAYDDSKKRMETMSAIDLSRIYGAGSSLPGSNSSNPNVKPGGGGYK